MFFPKHHLLILGRGKKSPNTELRGRNSFKTIMNFHYLCFSNIEHHHQQQILFKEKFSYNGILGLISFSLDEKLGYNLLPTILISRVHMAHWY